MANNYTQAEIASAIASLMRTTVPRTYGPLGNRETNVSFGAVQDAAAGVFVAYPNSPYYIVLLATLALLEIVQTAEETALNLSEAVRSTDRVVTPVDSISDLANARSAVGALASASSSRSTSLSRLDQVPAYKRFDQSSQRFLATAGLNVKSDGSVVSTPQEARASIAGLVSQLEELMDVIVFRSTILAGAIEDYDRLNIPATLSAYILGNAHSSLSDAYDKLEPLSPEDRLGPMREIVLSLLAARSTIKAFGALDPVTQYIYFDGNIGPYWDVDHPAQPATLHAEAAGYYNTLIVGDEPATLMVMVDDTYPLEIPIPESYTPQIQGFAAEPFQISSDNDSLQVNHIGVFLPHGTLSAATVAEAITVYTSAHGIQGREYGASTYSYSTNMTLTPLGMLTVKASSPFGDWTFANVPANGDWVRVHDSSDAAADGWYSVVDASSYPAFFVLQKETGTVVDAVALADLNKGGRSVLIEYIPSVQHSSVDFRYALKLTGTAPQHAATVATLGMVNNVEVKGQPSPAKFIADFINASPAIVAGGVARLSADQAFREAYSLKAVTDPSDGTLVRLYQDEFSSIYIQYTESVGYINVPAEHLMYIEESDYVYITTWAVYALVQGKGTEGITVSLPVHKTTTPVTVQYGPSFSNINQSPAVLRVTDADNAANNGEYDVLDVVESFVVRLSRLLPAHAGLGSLSASLGTVSYGNYALVLQSQSTQLNSSLRVTGGNMQPVFWPIEVDPTAIGTTDWLSVPSSPKGVEVGDNLDVRFFPSDDTGLLTVSAVEVSKRLLRLETPVPSNTAAYPAQNGAPYPNIRVRKTHHDTYSALKSSLDVWLGARLSNTNWFFANLRRLLNPLTVNKNPTPVQVADAQGAISALYDHLLVLEGDLGGYKAPLVEPVDRLIDAYNQQGATRAVDYLLSAQFSAFFGLNQNEVSYLTSLTQAIQEVNVNDLPQSKFNRNSGGVITATYEETDYEVDFRDTDDIEEVSPPGDSYDYDGESAF